MDCFFLEWQPSCMRGAQQEQQVLSVLVFLSWYGFFIFWASCSEEDATWIYYIFTTGPWPAVFVLETPLCTLRVGRRKEPQISQPQLSQLALLQHAVDWKGEKSWKPVPSPHPQTRTPRQGAWGEKDPHVLGHTHKDIQLPELGRGE